MLLSRILNYFRDKLSNSERHALERETNADPFLSDAMDGFAKLSPDELESDLQALTQRLTDRTETRRNRKFYLYLSAAASVAILIGIGVLWYDFGNKNAQLVENNGKAKTEKQAAPKSDADGTKTYVRSEKSDEQDSAAPKNPAAAPKATASSTEKSFTEKRTQKVAETKTEPKAGKAAEKTSARRVSSAKPQPVAVAPSPNAALAERTIKVKGAVKNSEDSLPVPGASIFLKGTSTGVVADFDGKYEIKAKPGDTLVYSFVGLETKEIAVAENANETADVTLDYSQATLDEVVVVGYATEKKSHVTGSVVAVEADEIEEGRNLFARRSKKSRVREASQNYKPKGGFRKFRKYIKKNKRIDRDGKLEIETQITIAEDGKVDQVRVFSPCSEEIRTEIERLLKEGPIWKAKKQTKGNKQTVILKL